MGGPRDGSDFQNLHRNKRSLTLNLKDPEGPRDLPAPGREGRRGGRELPARREAPARRRLRRTCKKVNPRIVYGSISGFGQDGPYANRPGFDQIAQGMGGLMSITGLPGQGPVRVGIPIADLCAGLFCALGILTALLEREVSGEGQWVCTSLLEAQIFMLDFQAARWLHEAARSRSRPATIIRPRIPTGVFKTADGHINIAATGGPIWERFCQALGAPEMESNPDYATGKLRSQNREKLNAEIGSLTAKKTSAEWIELFNKAGVPCGPIYTIDQMFADPQVKHLGIAQSRRSRTAVRSAWSASR